MNRKQSQMLAVVALVCLVPAVVRPGARRVPLGDTRSAVGSSKIAVIDMARILRDWEEVKSATAKLTSYRCGYQDRIDPDQEQIKILNNKINAERDEKTREMLIVTKKKLISALQARFQSLKDELRRKEDAGFEAIKKRIYVAVDTIASRKGLEMILEKQWVYFPRNALDVTDEVLELLRNSAMTK